MAGQRSTELESWEMQRRVVSLYSQSVPVPAIAQQVGLSEDQVYRYIRRGKTLIDAARVDEISDDLSNILLMLDELQRQGYWHLNTLTNEIIAEKSRNDQINAQMLEQHLARGGSEDTYVARRSDVLTLLRDTPKGASSLIGELRGIVMDRARVLGVLTNAQAKAENRNALELTIKMAALKEILSQPIQIIDAPAAGEPLPEWLSDED